MLVIFKPQLLSARTADSRPGPGPPTRTSTFFTPCSCAATPAFSAATCAANGVLLREPRKPQPPAVAQDNVFPWRSVIVMMVLISYAVFCLKKKKIQGGHTTIPQHVEYIVLSSRC